MLYWNTINDTLKVSLMKLMQAEELKDFRLVGGTALTLYLGHRMSVDIDLFTDAAYGTIDFNTIELFLHSKFEYVKGDFGGNPGIGKSYLIGSNANSFINLDLYYTMDPFFQKLNEEEGIRMATVEEIVAMKVDIIQRAGRKKDFWDLHELLNRYTLKEMVAVHKQRFEWTHDEKTIYKNLVDFTLADDDFDPVCLKNKEWVFIKEDLKEAISSL
jgi:predicted nucleotidyltransferase component of viral defense system